MANIIKKLQAQEFRRKGWSISEIAKKLNMHKGGSISKWCQDIVLTKEQIERLVAKQESGSYRGRIIATEKIRKQRLREVELLRREGLKEVGKLNKRDLFITGVAMYWSEGYTYSGGEQVGFTNSDPRMILFILEWLEKICGVSKNNISLQVKINKIHKNRIKKVEYYWSNLTKIPPDQFNKTVLIKSKVKKVYSNPDSHYGTLRITVRQGTKLRRKINGWIEGLTKGVV